MKKHCIDKTGKRYGKLTVMGLLGYFTRKDGKKQSIWQCRCDCGEFVEARNDALTRKEKTCCHKCGKEKQAMATRIHMLRKLANQKRRELPFCDPDFDTEF